MNPGASPYAIELRGLSKRFGDLLANDRIDLRVRAGSIHAVIGENGAGKTTAMKMLYGMLAPDDGEILIDGVPRAWATPADAIVAGVGMVHQHFMLAGPYTALENVLLLESGNHSWFRPLDPKVVRRKLEALSTQYGLVVDWDQPVEKLSVGVQQRIEILKALYRDARILILDEPTAVLTPQETDALFANFRKLSEQGRTIVIITHKLREVKEFASEVTILRAGRSVAEVSAKAASEQELADLMVGRAVTLTVAQPPTPALGETVLELTQATLAATASGREGPRNSPRPRLEALSFRVQAGEVVGIAGVEGNGQQALLDLLIRPQDFRAELTGGARCLGVELAEAETRRLRDRGLAVIPADRHHEGLLLERPLTENFLLGFQRSRSGLIDMAALRRKTEAGIAAFDVRPRDPDAAAGRLSGGNQQKVIIARELASRDPAIRLLIAAQPTRGVDVGAIELIHRRIIDARTAGVGVLLVSSELSEIMALSDRVLVMYEGKIVGEFARRRAGDLPPYDESALGLLMGGGR